MPQQTVYIRNGDMEKWKALENKAEFISFHLNKTEPQENDDPYENLLLDLGANKVADTKLEEYIESTPEMIKELKRRGQVRN